MQPVGDVAGELNRLEPLVKGLLGTQKALADYLKLAPEDDGEALPATKKPADPSDRYPGEPRLGRLLGLLGNLRPHRQGHPSIVEHCAEPASSSTQ
jgi:hypothetical protein